jgi:hypothetical protein
MKLGIIIRAATVLLPRPLARPVVAAMQNENRDIKLLQKLRPKPPPAPG